MASMNSPFVDPEVDKTLPPLPATLSRRQESRIMSSQPVTSYQPSNNLRVQNPFADPLVEDKSKSASPATSSVPDSSSPGAGSGTQGTIPHARVAARDLTSEMASDSLPVDLKPSSAMSTASSAPFSSRTGITTLISNYLSVNVITNLCPYTTIPLMRPHMSCIISISTIMFIM